MAITGDFVNGLHIMLGKNSDMDNGSPKVTATSENTFFLNWESGDVYAFSGGSWAEADDNVAGIVAALLNKGALPAVTSDDNGKVLKVVSGVWAAGTGGGGSVTVDDALDDDSENPVQNKVITDAFDWALDHYSQKPTVTPISGATPTIAAADNTIYSCGELTSLTITDSTQDISFTVDFTSGATATTLTVPSGYKAPGGDLTPEANKTYELNVRNGKAVLTAFEAVSASA